MRRDTQGTTWHTIARLVACVVLLWLIGDLADASTPGAFNFNADESVDAVLHRAGPDATPRVAMILSAIRWITPADSRRAIRPSVVCVRRVAVVDLSPGAPERSSHRWQPGSPDKADEAA